MRVEMSSEHSKRRQAKKDGAYGAVRRKNTVGKVYGGRDKG